MTEGMYRIGIVGATTLLGKELSDELQDSLLAASDFILLDAEEVTGQVASVGEEAAFIQRLDATSFDRMDFVFFAGDRAVTAKHWEVARKAGASIVDMSDALEQEVGVPTRAPWVAEVLRTSESLGTSDSSKGRNGNQLNLATPAVVAAHPAAAMLALVAARVQASMKVRSFAVTLIEPASQHGREAMDELHQQTVNLLSFQSLPREQYAAQIAFNLLPTLGEGAKVKLRESEERIGRHYRQVGPALPELELYLVQAPVFHGYVASVLLELEEDSTVSDVERALAGEAIDVVAEDSDPPSNLSAAGQEDIMVRVRTASGNDGASRRFWLWLAADNLKLGALNGIACANELRRLRPRGKVQ